MKKSYFAEHYYFIGDGDARPKNTRVFDNFDTERGVRVVAPKVAPLTDFKTKPLVKKTVQTFPNEQIISKGKYIVKLTGFSKLMMSAGKSMETDLRPAIR